MIDFVVGLAFDNQVPLLTVSSYDNPAVTLAALRLDFDYVDQVATGLVAGFRSIGVVWIKEEASCYLS